MKFHSIPRAVFAGLLLFLRPSFLPAEPLISPTWGFGIDLPVDFDFLEGDGKNKFAFSSPSGVHFDLAVYPASAHESVEIMAKDVQKRLKNSGDIASFNYYGMNAVLVELSFSGNEGWGLCIELEEKAKAGGTGEGGSKPKLLALSYGPGGNTALQPVILSALDSIAPTNYHLIVPGPVTEFAYPRENREKAALANSNTEVWIYDTDAEAAQSLVNREFNILRRAEKSPLWKEAWIRFYRAIFRDSFDRLAAIASALEKDWDAADIPAKALKWVQSFKYERDLMGSDFVNLVSAAIEGRGDCDSRALLWAVLLSQADIPAAIMVSKEYSHAMGLADINGPGARFEFENRAWLVAETTAMVDLGLINAKTSDKENWIGINFY
ncbi:MAG: hypothetical protein LBT16_13050 [Treponema sp.]|nr:hypothetical protein [Treponema sp.]